MMGMTRFMLVQLRLRLPVPCDPQAHLRTKGRPVHVSNASRCPAYSVLLRLKKMSYPRPMKRPGTVVDVSKNKAALAVSNEEGWTVVELIGSEDIIFNDEVLSAYFQGTGDRQWALGQIANWGGS